MIKLNLSTMDVLTMPITKSDDKVEIAFILIFTFISSFSITMLLQGLMLCVI